MNKEQFKAMYRQDRINRKKNERLYKALKKQFTSILDQDKIDKIYAKKWIQIGYSASFHHDRYKAKNDAKRSNSVYLLKSACLLSANISRINLRKPIIKRELTFNDFRK